MSRFDARKQRAQEHRKARLAHMSHAVWGVICIVLLMTLAGVWIQAQSLEQQTATLEQQLAKTEQQPTDTCKVVGNWKAGATYTRGIGGRQYLVHTPASFSGSAYYPVVMLYPGKGASAQAAQAAYGLDVLPALLVYPYPTVGSEGVLAWQGAPYSSKADDVAFSTRVLDDLQANLCIDRTKIYAAGFSNGGGFAAYLGCSAAADRFAAFAVIAGAMYAPAGDCTPKKPRPLLSVHGDQDSVVPYSGSLTRHLPHIDNWIKKRAQANGCTAQTGGSGGFNIYTTTWSKCKDDATVQNIRIQGGGHGWGQITNTSLWQFLSQFSL